MCITLDNSSAKEVESKVKNVAKKTHKQIIRKLFKQNNKSLPRLNFETCCNSTFLMCESMLLVRDLSSQITMANESFFLSDIDWFAVEELTKCLKPVYDTTTAIELKKLTTGEFFSEWLKCEVQLQLKSVRHWLYFTS